MGKNNTNQAPVLMDGLPDLPELRMTEVQLQAQQTAIERATNAVQVRGQLLGQYAEAVGRDAKAKADIEREKRSLSMLKFILLVEALTIAVGCLWYVTIGVGDFISARAIYLIQLDLDWTIAYILAGCTAWLWPILIFLSFRRGTSSGTKAGLRLFACLWIVASVYTTASYIANDSSAQARDAYKQTTAYKAAKREADNIEAQIQAQRGQIASYQQEGTDNARRQAGYILNSKIPDLIEAQKAANLRMEHVREATDGEGIGALYNSLAKALGTQAGPMLFAVALLIALALTGSNLMITLWAAGGKKSKGAA